MRPGRAWWEARRRALTVLAGGALLLTACDRIANSSPEARLQRRVARLRPSIERNTGLRFKREPVVALRSSAEVRRFVEQGFRESRAARDLAGYELAYKMFGLMPPKLSLRKILLDLLEEQVAGFYDPKTKALYVVTDMPSNTLDVTVAHELVHALQDQYVNLDSLRQAELDNDAATAAQAAVEGHATYISMLGLVKAEDLAAVPGGWGTIATGIRQQSTETAGLGAAPDAVREGLIFPYAAGLPFVAALYAARPGAALLQDVPRSTEQVLHPAAYGEPRDHPTRVVLPALPGLTVRYENTLGEFETRLVLTEQLRDTVAAFRAARGWDGDRYAVVALAGGGEGLLWATVWDSPADADDLRAQLAAAYARRYRMPAAAPGADGATAAGRTVTVASATVGGRPVVVLSDLPEGASAAPLDGARVQLREP